MAVKGCLLTSDVYNNNIRSNLLDILKRNADVRLRVEEVKKLISARNNHLTNLTAAFIEFQIRDSS